MSIFASSTSVAFAVSLIVVASHRCHFCARWHQLRTLAEDGQIYHRWYIWFQNLYFVIKEVIVILLFVLSTLSIHNEDNIYCYCISDNCMMMEYCMIEYFIVLVVSRSLSIISIEFIVNRVFSGIRLIVVRLHVTVMSIRSDLRHATPSNATILFENLLLPPVGRVPIALRTCLKFKNWLLLILRYLIYCHCYN